MDERKDTYKGADSGEPVKVPGAQLLDENGDVKADRHFAPRRDGSAGGCSTGHNTAPGGGSGMDSAENGSGAQGAAAAKRDETALPAEKVSLTAVSGNASRIAGEVAEEEPLPEDDELMADLKRDMEAAEAEKEAAEKAAAEKEAAEKDGAEEKTEAEKSKEENTPVAENPEAEEKTATDKSDAEEKKTSEADAPENESAEAAGTEAEPEEDEAAGETEEPAAAAPAAPVRRPLPPGTPLPEVLQKLAEQPVPEGDTLCRMLKETSFLYVREGYEEKAAQVLEVFLIAVERHPNLRSRLFEILGLLGCMAFKEGMPRIGAGCAHVLMGGLLCLNGEDSTMQRQGFTLLQGIMGMAARMRDSESFHSMVEELAAFREKRKNREGAGFMAVLLDLLFIAADRRWMPSLTLMGRLSREVLHAGSIDDDTKKRFIIEWGVLGAQIAQRGWLPETHRIMWDICIFLGEERNPVLTRAAFTDCVTHMQMHSHWESQEAAFRAYYPWQCLALALVHRYSLRLLRGDEEARDVLVQFFRGARDLMANVARLTLRQETDMLQEWMDLWLEETEGNPRRQRRVKVFLQMVAGYWCYTQPDTSRRQKEKLHGICVPSLVTGRYMTVLQTIV